MNKERPICGKCGREKHTEKDKSRIAGFAYKCRYCSNIRSKERKRMAYELKKQDINARRRLRYNEVLKYDPIFVKKQKERHLAINQKKERIEYQKAYSLNRRLLANVGSYCHVHNRVCVSCGKKECVRTPSRDGQLDRCRSCYTKYVRSLGFKVKEKCVSCPKCGVEHIGKKKDSMCKDCKAARAKESRRKQNRNSGRDGYRRAKKKGNVSVRFNVKTVFDRDGWRCCMCKRKVQKKDIYAPNAAEVDHIVPIAKGGAHAPYNVQTLCRECNLKKSDKIIEAQQRLPLAV